MTARATAAFLCLLGGLAHAQQKQRVVVLEYRAGSRGAPHIGTRIAETLAQTSTYEVITPTDARRKLGAGLDAEVAHCAGDARCVATLGQRLSADEALLVGVSELGDIVLALQRVDTKRGVAVARLAESLAAGTETTDRELGDWMHQLFPADAFLRYGQLRISSQVDSAEITVNGNAMGKTPLGDPLRLPAPGTYRLRLEKPGYTSFQVRIDVPPDSTIEVRATLAPLTGVAPWYKRAYVWGPVGAVIAAAGIGVAVYYGTRIDQTPHGYIAPPP